MVNTLFSHSCFRVPEVLMEKPWSVEQPPGLEAIFHFSSVSPYVTFFYSGQPPGPQAIFHMSSVILYVTFLRSVNLSSGHQANFCMSYVNLFANVL
jgi:hypothetical protein